MPHASVLRVGLLRFLQPANVPTFRRSNVILTRSSYILAGLVFGGQVRCYAGTGFIQAQRRKRRRRARRKIANWPGIITVSKAAATRAEPLAGAIAGAL